MSEYLPDWTEDQITEAMLDETIELRCQCGGERLPFKTICSDCYYELERDG